MIFKRIPGQSSAQKKTRRTEKRDFVRLVYPPDKRPILEVDGNSFEVLNISEKGLKFLNHMGKPFGRQVFGKVRFHNSGSIKIHGKILWENGPEIGLFITNIPAFVIKQEIRTFISQEASADTIVTDGASLEAARDQPLPEENA